MSSMEHTTSPAGQQQPKLNPEQAKRVIVIGAGAGGLTVAHRLQERGHEVTVLEKGPEVSGLAGGFKFGSTVLDRFYRHIFTSDVAIRRLIDELGLEEKLQWLESSVGIYYEGQTYPFSKPQHLLGFSPISLWGRFRFGLGFLRMKFEKNWRALESVTAEEYIIRLMGLPAYRVIWEPLLRSKFGERYREVSAVWFWGKIQLRGGTRDDTGTKEKLGYLLGGFSQLFERQAEHVREHGGEIVTKCPVESVRRKPGGGFEVQTGSGEYTADAVVCTPAPAIMAELCPELPTQDRERLEDVPYQGSVVVVLPLREPLDTHYWVNINDPEVPFVALINQRAMVDDSGYDPYYPVYLSRYLSTSNPLYSMPANELVPLFKREFVRLFPDARLDDRIPGWRFRAEYTQPVVRRHYSDTVPPFETETPGLFLSCMAQVYPEDRGMNYAIDCGERFVDWWYGEESVSKLHTT